eukprot:TRINITY_DN8102_c0_g1_i1.p3 TRINITY_DN8102_c0_g1~~TRINITY_DN8102_c0_g1_i1.p3  ORF type:complete len:124 (+),score=22.89 TRINITY_DN8102_c0_g1_i1:199-570(+)
MCIRDSITTMDLENQAQLFKNIKWTQRKKELKQSRSQRQNKNLKQICTNELTSNNQFNYMSIEGPFLLKPAKKYCDITGFETNYKDRNTGLYYHDKYIYNYIKNLSRPAIEQFLSIRKITPIQ